MNYVLYNPHANNGNGKEGAEKLKDIIKDKELQFIPIEDEFDYEKFFSSLANEDEIVLCGGDGTINRFVNKTKNITIKNDIKYCACGTGNDFLHDIEKSADELIDLNDYIADLPTVTVNGEEYKFLNGVGYGIDGYCCEEGDRLRAKSTKKINYTAIAIKGLLFTYQPTNATVIVDGQEHKFSKVWIAPTMNGRCYGGGMYPTPNQSRKDNKLSICILHGSGKLKTLMIFPSIFKGEHVTHTDHVTVLSGHEITVRFDQPRSLQVDGETFLNVSEYTAKKN